MLKLKINEMKQEKVILEMKELEKKQTKNQKNKIFFLAVEPKSNF